MTTFQYEAKDDQGAYDATPATATITVTEVNDQPVRTAGSVSNLTVAEDSGLTSLGLGSLAYSNGGGSDESGQTLTYTVTAVPASTLGDVVLADGTTVVNASDVLTLTQLQGLQFRTAANTNGGPATFSFTVTDDGTTNGGADPQVLTESLTITVTEVNDQPVRTAGSVSNLTVAEDSGLTSLGLGSLAYSNGGGSDESGQILTYTVTAVPASTLGDVVLADGTTVVNASDVLTLTQLQGLQFRTAANTNGGPATFSFTVTDDGTTNGGADPQAIAESMTITVTAVNDAPVTSNAAAGGTEDAASMAVTLTGSDVDGTVTDFRLTTLPANGTLYTDVALTTAAATGVDYTATAEALTLYFVPNGDWNGVTTFQYEAKDDQGAYDATPATATITVTEVNDQPVRTAGSVSNLTVAEDSGLTSLGLGSLAYSNGGGSDESGQTLTYTVTAVPASTLGDVVLADGTTVVNASDVLTLTQLQGLQFRTAANTNGGPATFSFTVTDDGATNGGADPQVLAESLTITVTEVNDQPVRTAGSVNNLTVAEDSGLTSASGLRNPQRTVQRRRQRRVGPDPHLHRHRRPGQHAGRCGPGGWDNRCERQRRPHADAAAGTAVPHRGQHQRRTGYVLVHRHRRRHHQRRGRSAGDRGVHDHHGHGSE